MLTITKEFGPIRSEADLVVLQRELLVRHPDVQLLYRGQFSLYPTVRSGRSRPGAQVPADELAGWRAVVDDVLRPFGTPVANHRFRMAVLQHYGLATYFVDLTASLRVAAWFASSKYSESKHLYIGNALREQIEAHYSASNDGRGYLFVFVYPNAGARQKQGHLFDLTTLPGFLRPARQHGWLAYDRRPLQPDPNEFCKYVIEVDRASFRSSLSHRELFPPVSDDAGYRHLLSQPFVQIPTSFVDDPTRNAASSAADADATDETHSDPVVADHAGPAVATDASDGPEPIEKDEPTDKVEYPLGSGADVEGRYDRLCLGQRVISVPAHVYDKNRDQFNHKWSDVTVFEPHHMRLWYRWNGPLGQAYDGAEGNINQSTKITLAPSARKVLRKAGEEVALAWPSLGSSSLFFTFAEWDHDKVVDHGPPYFGVWLTRLDDLILEVPMLADDEDLTMMPGHAYLFWDGELIRQDHTGSCICDEPEDHDLRVSQALRLHSLVRSGEIKLVRHPARLPNWYIAW